MFIFGDYEGALLSNVLIRIRNAVVASNLRQRLLTIDGVMESPSMFLLRPAFWVNGKEIAHEDADGIYDVRLTRQVIRQMRARLRAEPRVRLRPSSSSDWIEVEVADADGEELLVDLVLAAVTAHRPPPGTRLRPPPQDEELARRRRFH
jgi:hypothetical protein